MSVFKPSLWLVPTACALLAGCGSDDLPDYFLLDRLRVVAASVSGAAAEFSAGDAGVSVVFHVSDPKGAGRTLTYSLEACVDPGVGLGATPSCAGNPTRTVLTASATTTLAADYYGTITTPAFAVPAAAVVFANPATGALRPAYEQANGVGYLVVMNLSAGSETISAFKRVVVSTKATKNQNPTFASPALLFGGVDAATYTLTTAPFTIVASAAAGSAETYAVENSDGTTDTKGEKLTATYLITDGEIHDTRGDPGVTNSYSPSNPLPASSGFIVVLRDERGGVAVTAIQKP